MTTNTDTPSLTGNPELDPTATEWLNITRQIAVIEADTKRGRVNKWASWPLYKMLAIAEYLENTLEECGVTIDDPLSIDRFDELLGDYLGGDSRAVFVVENIVMPDGPDCEDEAVS